MQPGRRFFLTGGRLFGGPWAQFVQRLDRMVKGRVEDQSVGDGQPPQARLSPARPEDVHHARALCAECRVRMALVGTAVAVDGSVLWVDPAPLRGLDALADQPIRMAPGTPAGELRERRLAEVDPADDDTPLAIWLANLPPAAVDRLLAAQGGLESADVLLFDGKSDTLGRFGAKTERAPLGLALRDVVSELFRLGQRPSMKSWREHPVWPARYRLDALWRDEPNLAHLLAGSAGTLAWLESTTWSLVQTPAALPRPQARPPQDAAEFDFAAWVEDEVKQAFDPETVLVALPRRGAPA